MKQLVYTFSAIMCLLAAFLGVWWVQSYNKDLTNMRDMVEAEINRMISEDFVFGELQSVVMSDEYIEEGVTLDNITGISTPYGSIRLERTDSRLGSSSKKVTVSVLGGNHRGPTHFYYEHKRLTLAQLPETVRDSIQRKFGIDLHQYFPEGHRMARRVRPERAIHVAHVGPATTKAGTHFELANYRSSLFLGLLPEFLFGSMLLGATGFAFASAYRNLYEQERQIRQKDALVANVAHELKTPIATVGVALEALNMFGADADPARRREYLTIGQSELQRLDQMADRAIDSLQGGEDLGQRLRRTPTDLTASVHDAWRGLSLRYQLAEEALHLKVYGNAVASVDPHYWHHLVYNLLDNACKYGGAPPRIEVVIAERDGRVEFSVTDNGPGVPVAERGKVFERFHRVYREGEGHAVKGHGLGLTFVRQVAQAHGGNVRVEEAIGGGARFVVGIGVAA